ncbi:MAG: phosphoenolpyruvate carboxykinase [Nanoarchaeota archaeon]|nr:phosphoenolpyruvate carboxykinase [Nanoarchaeota archaeon]MBU1849712.1 phosphoenolpyruvate carboxykinase [Nanoarchaeota archaeon]
MKGSFSKYDNQIIISSNGELCQTNEELLETEAFKKVLSMYLDFLRGKNSPLLEIIPKHISSKEEQNKKILKLLQELTIKKKKTVIKNNPELEGFFADTYNLNQFVEELYNFWRNFERFFILFSESKTGQNYHKQPYRSFHTTIEQLNHLVRGSYRDICENITSNHPQVYRQVPAGFEVGIIASKSKTKFSKEYLKLNNIHRIRQVLIEPPLILNPTMNKRSGSFKEIHENPMNKMNLNNKEWLCFPAKVGELIIHVFFHYRFISLGISLANLFDLVDETEIEKKPDAIYLFGVDEESLKKYGEPQTVFYDDKKNDLLMGFVSRRDEYNYFGYTKKMILTLHNIACMKKGRLPVHGAMVKIELKSGIKKNIIIIGDSGAGKSESLEAFRTLSQEHLRNMTIIFDDMGSLSIENDKLKAYGTETGAFVRLDDLHPGFVYGNLDRSIIMSPDKINARAVIPITTLKEIIEGHEVNLILYANNYEFVEDKQFIHYFHNWEEAFNVFKEGKRMAKGTTSEIGLTKSYFANPFGPHQFKKIHEDIAEKYFKFFFEKNIRVGEIRTMLGIKGYESKGPEQAAKALFKSISE